MNCQACGAQLPDGAAACPNCGTKTPYYYSNSGASPHGPTVVAPSGSYNTPNTPARPSTFYGAGGYDVPPPPPYAADPYSGPAQNPYQAPTQLPYNFQPPPPQKQGSNKRTAIIVSVGLLFLILIGILVAIIAIPRNSSNNTTVTQNKNTPVSTQAPVVANPYPPNTGTLVLSDPMQDNSKGYKWDEATMNGNSSCNFVGQAYHATTTVKGALICNPEAQSLNFNNLAYEVQLTAVKGDYEGVVFRTDQIKETGYVVAIGVQGNYLLGTMNLSITDPKNQYKILSHGTNAAIKKGLNQSNLLAIVANGNAISLYVNNEFVTSIHDSTYTGGQIGIYGEGDAGPADIMAGNVRVWRL